MREYFFEISVALGALVMVCGAFGVGTLVRGQATDVACAESVTPLTCFEEYYSKRLMHYSSSVVLQEFKSKYERDETLSLYCHPIVHLIGAAAGREYGSIAEAYVHGDTVCRSGYHHGVLEGIFGDAEGDELLRDLDDICAAVSGKERYSYNYFSCVHGIGHGLMAYFNHDLFESLRGCDRLRGEWERESCYGGVFMENILSDTAEMPSRFLRADDPLYPCTAVDGTYKRQCFLMQTSHMLSVFANDYAQTFAACTSIESEYRTHCYQSIGRDVSGQSYGSRETVYALCAHGKEEQERDCLIGAAVDFIQSEGIEEAQAVCEGSSHADACTAVVRAQIEML